MARCARRTCGRWRPDALVRHGHLGLWFNDGWYCSTRCLEIDTQVALSEAPAQPDWVSPPSSLRVGRMLLHRQLVSPAALDRALLAQRETGRRLGAELVAMGVVTQEEVLRALAAQAGVGYMTQVDPSRVAAGVLSISPDTVRALGVVPFEASVARQRLCVACTSPLPGPSLAALREMTGWIVEPYLVGDAALQRLLEAYGRTAPGSRAQAPLRSLSDAAARIAGEAERGVVRRMQHVRCDPYVWVRLEGETHAEDLLVTLDHTREDAWQAAHTRH